MLQYACVKTVPCSSNGSHYHVSSLVYISLANVCCWFLEIGCMVIALLNRRGLCYINEIPCHECQRILLTVAERRKNYLNPISHPELKSSVNSNKVDAKMLI